MPLGGETRETPESRAVIQANQAHSELESQQQIWKGLLLAALALVLAETLLASRTSDKLKPDLTL